MYWFIWIVASWISGEDPGNIPPKVRNGHFVPSYAVFITLVFFLVLFLFILYFFGLLFFLCFYLLFCIDPVSLNPPFIPYFLSLYSLSLFFSCALLSTSVSTLLSFFSFWLLSFLLFIVFFLCSSFPVVHLSLFSASSLCFSFSHDSIAKILILCLIQEKKPKVYFNY